MNKFKVGDWVKVIDFNPTMRYGAGYDSKLKYFKIDRIIKLSDRKEENFVAFPKNENGFFNENIKFLPIEKLYDLKKELLKNKIKKLKI